jgi:hypothetical protein
MSLSCLVFKIVSGVGVVGKKERGGAIPSCAIGLVEDVVLARAAALKVSFFRHGGFALVLESRVKSDWRSLEVPM